MSERSRRVWSRVLLFLGVVLGLSLAVIGLWNRAEATTYHFTGVTYPPFPGLRCPLVVAAGEEAPVTAEFENPRTQEDVFFYRVRINENAPSAHTIEDNVSVPARQTRRVRLAVDARDVDLRFFVFVKITVLPNAFHTTQEAVCGILVTDLPGLSGEAVSGSLLTLSFLGIAAGLSLWRQGGAQPDEDFLKLVQALVVTVLLALLAVAAGWWGAAAVFSVVTLLLLVISARFALT